MVSIINIIMPRLLCVGLHYSLITEPKGAPRLPDSQATVGHHVELSQNKILNKKSWETLQSKKNKSLP